MSELINDSNKKKGLGRGLGSLLGGSPASSLDSQKTNLNTQSVTNSIAKSNIQTPQAQSPTQQTTTQASPAIQTEGKVWQVAIDKIQSGEYQPRKNFEKEPLSDLANSIKAHGILQPIIVRKVSGSNKFEIVAGERRWRAAQQAGLHEVPVLIKSFDDKQSLELAIIENVQREDLDPIEEAEGYSRLATEFSLSHQVIAEKVGKDRATVSNAIRLLVLPLEVRQMVQKKDISVGHAKVLLSLQDSTSILNLARRTAKEKMSVRKLEKEVQMALHPEEEVKSVSGIDQNVAARLIQGLSEELQKKLGTKVVIDYANSKGKISIYFYSDEELTQLVENIKEN